MDDYPLFGNIDAIVEAHASGTGAEPPQRYAFTHCITKRLQQVRSRARVRTRFCLHTCTLVAGMRTSRANDAHDF